MKTYECCRTEVRDGIALLTLNRPPLNLFDTKAWTELIGVLGELGEKPEEVRVLIVTGAGEKAFSCGADLREAQKVRENPELAEPRNASVRNFGIALETFPQPTIAAVNGLAVGAGLWTTLHCDLRIASERATFSMPEIKVGALGGTRAMQRFIPQGLVREMFFTGDPIDAHEAYRVGLVGRVVPHDKLMDEAFALARRMSRHSPLALRLAKQMMRESEVMPLHEGYAHEQTFTTKLRASGDAQEALKAFFEKRRPSF